MKLIDVVCSNGHITLDVYVATTAERPACACGAATERAWLSAPSITPQGTRPERNTERSRPQTVNTKAIAAETKAEIEQKWLRYSDPQVAEQHVSREINEAAGIADAAGNEKPIPKPAPITMATMTAANAG